MDKPDVRALAEDVPADVPDDVKRCAIAHSCAFADPSIQAFVERRIISAIMADRRATRETAIAEGRRQRQGLEEAALLAEAQPFYPDTHTGTRQQWVKDQIAAAIPAIAQKAEG